MPDDIEPIFPILYRVIPTPQVNVHLRCRDSFASQQINKENFTIHTCQSNVTVFITNQSITVWMERLINQFPSLLGQAAYINVVISAEYMNNNTVLTHIWGIIPSSIWIIKFILVERPEKLTAAIIEGKSISICYEAVISFTDQITLRRQFRDCTVFGNTANIAIYL